MDSAPLVRIDEGPTLTLADIDADTGKYHDPAGESYGGERHIHTTDDEFLACLESRRSAPIDD